MTGRDRGKPDDSGRSDAHGLQRQKTKARPGSEGNFQDLESLLDQLGEAPVFQLGKPLPQEKFMPKMRAGSCPAAHNRALLGEEKP